jgi:hypothetical protein
MTLTRLIVYGVAMILVMKWACGDWDRATSLVLWMMGWEPPSFYFPVGAALVLIGVVDCLHRLVSRRRRNT